MSTRRPAIAPVVWQPPAPRKPSSRPMPAPTPHPLPGAGPEDVAIDAQGRVVTGLGDGRILRLTPATGAVEELASTGGRPLGIEVDADGSFVVCDTEQGLLRVTEDGAVTVLVPTTLLIDGQPLGVCNNAAIAGNGDIWFSDSSARFPFAFWKGDLLEHSGTGRLLRRDPEGTVEVRLTGLHFANGVALAADESFVVVAETGAYRLTRLWLTGSRAGEHEVLVDNLPGFPDNIARGSDGLIWIAMASPRNAALDLLSPRAPLLRRLLWSLPDALLPKPAATVWVMAVDESGRVVHDLLTRVPGFSMVTGVRERDGQVWLGSLESAAVAAFTLG